MINGRVEELPHRLFYDRLLSYAFIDPMFPLCACRTVLVLFVLLSGVLAVTGSYMYLFFCTLHQEFATCTLLTTTMYESPRRLPYRLRTMLAVERESISHGLSG